MPPGGQPGRQSPAAMIRPAGWAGTAGIGGTSNTLPTAGPPTCARGESWQSADRRRRRGGSKEDYAGQMDYDAIQSLVTRLARAHPSGGSVIERAAILAEGADSDAVITWIVDH